MTRRASSPLDLDDLAARLHSVAIHLLRRVRRDEAETGLGPARLSALSVLVYGGPRTLGQLAAAEQVTAPSMSRLVAALEVEGLVTRRPHPEDARSVVLRPTAAARSILEKARRRRVEQLAVLLASLDSAAFERIDRATRDLEGALGEPAA